MPTSEEIIEKLKSDLSISNIIGMQNNAQSIPELNAITEIGIAFADARLQEAIKGYKAGTRRFLNVTEKILDMIADLDRRFAGISPQRNPSDAPVLDGLIGRVSEALRLFHDDEGMRTTHTSDQEVEDIENDEAAIAPSLQPTAMPANLGNGEILHAPTTSKSKKFEEIADEYVRFFMSAGYKNDHEALVRKFALKAIGNRSRYEEVGNPLRIPWWFVACIHLLESSFNFKTHLHNGDPLTARTFRVPSGRPKHGNAPFSWEASARDALVHHELAHLSDWSLPRALCRWERYNGFGYRSRQIPTPYLWSFSTIYEKGKFVGDGVFKASAVSKQCGCAAILKYLHENGHVDLGLDVVGEDESGHGDPDGDADAVVRDDKPNIDDNVPASHAFEGFFTRSLPAIRHFEWHEFLVKGGAHQQNGLNTDPPEVLWENVIPLAQVLDEFREQTGLPVVLTSVYRSPAYNTRIGGASRSQHMAFTAADFKVVGNGAGTTGQWAARLRNLRAGGRFKGGIGIYPSFVHVDVRGHDEDWDER